MKRLLWSVLAIGLAGCATTPQAPSLVVLAPPKVTQRSLKDIIPKTAMVCAAEPAGTVVKTERQAATYIEDVRSAGRDCRRKLGVMRNLILSERR